MSAIYDMCEWTRVDELLANRVSIANQILGARYDGDLSNPVRVVSFRGGRRVMLCGERFCEYLMYDLQSIRDAFARVDALSDSLWLLRRGKAIRCGDFNQHDDI